MMVSVWAACNLAYRHRVDVADRAQAAFQLGRGLCCDRSFASKAASRRLQLLRHRSRTTLTVGVVFIAVATGIGLASSVIDNVSNVQNWYHKAFTADFFVRAMAPDMASGLMADLPDTLGMTRSRKSLASRASTRPAS